MSKNTVSINPPGNAIKPTLQRFLKNETQPLHARTEKVFDLKRRVATLAGYRDTLVGLYRLHAASCTALHDVSWGDLEVDLAPTRQRLDWLRGDLSYFGLVADDLPPIPHLVLADAAEGLGCLYVIEGSMLGGAFISRAIRQRLGVTTDTGGRFFYGFGDGTDAAWSSFVTALDRHLVTTVGYRAAIGARKTFNLFAVVGAEGSKG